MGANLEMIGGVLMLLAHRMNQSALERLPGASVSRQDDDRFMRLVEKRVPRRLI